MKLCLPENGKENNVLYVVENEFSERRSRPEHGTTFTGDANEASNPCANIKEPFPPFENGSPSTAIKPCSRFLADKFKAFIIAREIATWSNLINHRTIYFSSGVYE